MSLFDWFADRRKGSPLSKERQMREIADGLWQKCLSCDALTYAKDLQENAGVCPSCGYHNRLTAHDRIRQLIAPGTWRPLDSNMVSQDPLKFVDSKPYPDRIRSYQARANLADAVLTGTGHIRESSAAGGQPIPVALGVMDFRFMGGSMGSVVGEKITRLTERATAEHLPLIVCSASGGARMHEGILSLMQMAKTSAALERHRAAGQLFISVLTNPTYGGVTASFAMLGDIIIAEPQALIGFAGGRVIEQTIGQKLPEGFQTSEYLLEHGLIDAIVVRPKLKRRLAKLIALHYPSLLAGVVSSPPAKANQASTPVDVSS